MALFFESRLVVFENYEKSSAMYYSLRRINFASSDKLRCIIYLIFFLTFGILILDELSFDRKESLSYLKGLMSRVS